jgi:glycosyltransferase involved in cell wall biosynthesis
MTDGLHVLSITTNPWLAVQDDVRQLSGAQRRQVAYAGFLRRYTVITRSLRSMGLEPVSLAQNLEVIPTNSRGRFSFMWDAYHLGVKVCCRMVVDCIACSDPFSTAIPAYWLKRRFGIPLNVHVQADLIDNPYFIRERPQYRVFNWVARWAVRQADTLRVSTSVERTRFIGRGFAQDRVWYVPFYVDPAPFLRAEGVELRQRLLGETFERLVLFVGRLSRQKDIPTLLHAARRVMDARPKTLFVIAGHGDCRTRLEALAVRLGLAGNVRFVGPVGYSDIPYHYAACDVFAITSVYEGTCMVLLEAALAGKPVVATAFAGAYDAIEDSVSGYIVSIRDSQAVAERVTKLLDDPALSARMGAAGRELVRERFRPSAVLERYRRMWEVTSRCSQSLR